LDFSVTASSWTPTGNGACAASAAVVAAVAATVAFAAAALATADAVSAFSAAARCASTPALSPDEIYRTHMDRGSSI